MSSRVVKHVLDAAIAVYDGQEHIGSVIARGRSAYEAFAADARSLGIYAGEAEAATAVWCAAHKQERRR
jgi:hypothetical protein